MGDVLVQTTVPSALARWIRGAAEKEGVSQAAFLRRLLMRERQLTTIDAWWSHQTENLNYAAFFETAPVFLFQPVANHQGGGFEVRVLDTDGRPMSDSEFFFRHSAVPQALDRGTGCFILRGSARPFRALRTYAENGGTGARTQMRILLEPIPATISAVQSQL